jgi:hypothetical protein
MKGDEAGAREVLKTLLSIEKTYKFDAAIFGKNLMMLVRDVQKKLGEEGLVNVTVQTNPPGGKIFVDGQYKGYSPLTIERMPTGRHLLRVERAGAVTFGQLVDVAATEETQIKAKLTPTPEYTALESVLDKIADEIDRGENHTELMRLGNRLKVDRAIVGLVRTNEQRVTLDCILVDFAARKKLVRMNRSFQGEEFGELQREVERFGNVLLSEGDNPTKVKKSSDPLDNHSGVEDWDEEGSGTKSDQNKPEKPKENKKKKNDLESETGTGDW